ncbi:MAG: hypothetical protein V4534_06045 [Myxococcota bacterium]
MIEISAPGKLVLAGEYAVLEGHAGLAMAVGRRVFLKPSSKIHRSELWSAIKTPDADAHFAIDSSALKEGAYKLGLGSSAASAVCMAALIDSEDAYRLALQGHKRFSAGLGSGIDVAASFYGGLIRFQQGEATPLIPSKEAAEYLMTVFVGNSQNTRSFLKQVLDFKAAKSNEYAAIIDELGALTNELQSFYTGTCGFDSLASIVSKNLELLSRLGSEAGIPIISQEQRNLQGLANEHGGFSKPSGAGGGDISLCFIPPERQNHFKNALSAPMRALDLDYFAPGLLIGP